MAEPVDPDRTDPRAADPASEPTRSLTGLIVGGLSLGAAQVVRGVRLLEDAAAEAPPPEPTPAESDPSAAVTPPPSFSQADLVRQGLTGFVIHSQRRMTRRAAAAEADVRRLSRRHWSRLPGAGRASQALGGRMARMEARGRRELARYAAIGQVQEHDAAHVAGAAFHRVADAGVDEVTTIAVTRVAESEVVHELFISQGSTMAEDLIDLIRERADSFDDALEHLARRFFRRGRPRPEGAVAWLPAPPPTVPVASEKA